MASALLMAAPLLIPFPTFGEKTLRDEVRINLDIAGQTTPSAEDLASMPEDMKEPMAESREALSDAGTAEDAGSFYDAVIRRCNAELEMIDKGYLSGDRDTDELRLRFAELMRDLDDPDYLGTSLDASALDAISLAPASMPALLALLPSLAIAFFGAARGGAAKAHGPGGRFGHPHRIIVRVQHALCCSGGPAHACACCSNSSCAEWLGRSGLSGALQPSGPDHRLERCWMCGMDSCSPGACKLLCGCRCERYLPDFREGICRPCGPCDPCPAVWDAAVLSGKLSPERSRAVPSHELCLSL